jgi:protein TonB
MVIEKGGTLDMVASTTAENGEVFTVVEKTALPVGGMPALYDLIGKNMQYPVEARRKNVEGKVFVQFIVNKDGSLSDFTVLKGIGEGCDEEAVRALSLSPNWTPGKQNGVAVKQRMVLPITFNL